MTIGHLQDISEDYLYACLYQHEKQIYGEKLLKALQEIASENPAQGDEQDEEYIVTLVRCGRFGKAIDMLEVLLGR